MAFQATVYRVLIASPNDVLAERTTIQEIISWWNAAYSAKMKTVLLPVIWETQSVPEMGGRPQAILNKQILKDCDILIGVFWTRIGTDIGFAESGTLKEIKEYQDAGKPVMIYFSSIPVIPSSIEVKQYEKLMKFMDDCLKQGLVKRYDSILEFREKTGRDIASIILNIHKKEGGEIPIDPGETAEKESNYKAFKLFCDLIGKYHYSWTAEKNKEPISLDDGRQIIKNLTKRILISKVQLVKIFSKDIIENIDQIISKLNKLQVHRLYFDNKSYADFWKLGDEIFASLNSIVGKVSKDTQKHT